MAIKWTNNAVASLSAGITATATNISVATSMGGLFPVLAAGEYFYATLCDSSNNIEIVKVTARSGDTMTVVRAQDNTVGRSYSAGDKFELRPTAAGLGTLARKDGDETITGNWTLSATWTFNATVNFTYGGAWGGTWSGNPTITGNPTYTGTPVFAVAPTFQGGANFSGPGPTLNNNAPMYVKNTAGTAYPLLGVSTDNWVNLYQAGNAGMRIVNQGTTTTLWSCDTGGNTTAVGNVTAYSDERLKDGWKDLGAQFVEDLANVKCGTYVRLDTGTVQVGVSAQSLQLVIPEAVNTDENGMLSVAYGNAALVACVKLAQEVVELKKELQALKG